MQGHSPLEYPIYLAPGQIYGQRIYGKVAHIIRKDDQMRGYVMGEEVIALCGERFIPTRDPERYPVCEGCKQALTMLRASGGN